MNKNIKVFLGGTCNDSTWRDRLIPKLKIDYFNPVVDDWTPAHQEEEVKQRMECDYCLYVITPLMTGVYAIAEVVDDSNKRPEKTILCVLQSDDNKKFTKPQIKSLNQVEDMVKQNGATICRSLDEVAKVLNRNINKSIINLNIGV